MRNLCNIRIVSCENSGYNTVKGGFYMGYNGYTEKKKITNKRYLDKLESFIVRISPDGKKELERAAAEEGKSRNAFILEAISEKIEREGIK